MPLLRIESRSKQKPSTGAPRPPKPGRTDQGSSSGAAMAALGGVVLGLIIVAGTAAFLLGRSGAQQAAAPGGAAQPGTPAPAGAVANPGAGTPLPAVTANLAPINADYSRETVIASVLGQPYTMGELEVAVRIARVLGAMTGDVVPADGSPDMRAFQVRMLKRQIDVMLMKQAAAEKNITLPGEPIASFIDDFVTRVGGTQARLQQLMAQNGVTQDQIDKWFEDSTLVNTFVAQELMAQRDPAEREQVTTAWLADQWKARESDILVNFYDPETVGASTGTPQAPSATAAP
jgi:hypothetical protein